MAQVGLNKIVRHIAKKQATKLMDAATKRYNRFKHLADKATDVERKRAHMRTAEQALQMGKLGAESLLAVAEKTARAYDKQAAIKGKRT
jgi:hypothetical protein